MLKNTLCIMVAVAATGCTSFRTTVLHRFSNDSVKPQMTNQKLKGLPVKLKVPSHVHVTIYEEQVILANSTTDQKELVEAAATAAIEVKAIQAKIDKLDSDVDAAQSDIDKIQAIIAAAIEQINSVSDPTDPVSQQTIMALELEIKNSRKLLAAAFTAQREALANLATKPKLEDDKQKAIDQAKLAAANTAVGYTLLSFKPAQFHVESELQYTDKIFLVDFKRPAGGVLNLKGASMDDEQYFADVQAEVTERTLSDIGDALTTVGGAVSKFKPTAATPVSANTPAADGTNHVNFQKSVIASKRFDISECGWEERMQDFVNEHLQRPDLIGQQPMEVDGAAPDPAGNQVVESLPPLALPYTEQLIGSQEDSGSLGSLMEY